MKKKEKLVQEINQFLLNNKVETVYLTEVGRNFETSTGSEEGSIEIIAVTKDEFLYFPAGHSDEELNGELNKLSLDDLKEILNGLDDWKADHDRTMKRASN
jgi:hypothetical protein